MAQLGRITKELQRVSMSLRMVPIRGVFQKMARVARDISAKQQKKSISSPAARTRNWTAAWSRN